MSVRKIQCPKCSAVGSLAVTITTARCPKCGTVWDVDRPPAKTAAQPTNATATSDGESNEDVNQVLVAARILGGLTAVLIVIGIGLYAVTAISGSGVQGQTAQTDEGEVVEFKIEKYRVIDLPGPARRRIYDDVRAVARTTREKPLILPAGSPIRQMSEETLQKTYDRELRRFAALHDVHLQDIGEVIKEGDAQGWDPTPRSNATRGGVRLYPVEMRKRD